MQDPQLRAKMTIQRNRSSLHLGQCGRSTSILPQTVISPLAACQTRMICVADRNNGGRKELVVLTGGMVEFTCSTARRYSLPTMTSRSLLSVCLTRSRTSTGDPYRSKRSAKWSYQVCAHKIFNIMSRLKRNIKEYHQSVVRLEQSITTPRQTRTTTKLHGLRNRV